MSSIGYGIFTQNLTRTSTSSVTFAFASPTDALVLFTPQPVNGGSAGSWFPPSTYYAYYFSGQTSSTFRVDLSQYYFILFAVGSSSSVGISIDATPLRVTVTQQFNNCAIDPSACPAVRNLLLSDGLGIAATTCSTMGTTAASASSIQLTGPAPTCEGIGGTQISELQASVVTVSGIVSESTSQPSTTVSTSTGSSKGFALPANLSYFIYTVVAFVTLGGLFVGIRTYRKEDGNDSPSSVGGRRDSTTFPGGGSGPGSTGDLTDVEGAAPSVLAITRSDSKYLIEYRPNGRLSQPLATKQLLEYDPSKRLRILKKLEDLTTTANLLTQLTREKRSEQDASPLVTGREGLGNTWTIKPEAILADLTDLGGVIFDYFLSTSVAETILHSSSRYLVIETNDVEVPWELMYDGSDFLATKHYVGRALVVETGVQKQEFQQTRRRPKAALIADPSETLPSAIEEVSLAGKLRQFCDVDVYQGKAIDTVEAIKVFGRGGYDLIHFAGHAEFDSVSPERSSLLFADGKLTAFEIKRIIEKSPSKPALVFVNACASAKEKTDSGIDYLGDRIGGLASPFLKAGVLCYIGATWPIYDRSARFFSSEFYSSALSGDAVGLALTRARRETLREYPNDLSWASFVLYGDPAGVVSKKV